ncbi:MAG: phosphate ABC transporter permease subunit PstC [Acidobacteriota bacterium]
MPTSRKLREFCIEKTIVLCGMAAVVFVILIFVFLLREGVSLFWQVPLSEFLAGTHWYPISEPPRFGILPLILGSLIVTAGAACLAVPVGVMSALYIAEVAPSGTRDVMKAGIEMLAAIPSVVIGFIGMVTLVPFVKTLFGLPTGLTALSGAIMLGFMAMPTIVSIAEDAIAAVPVEYKHGALALGATRWQTLYRVVLPAAAPGILAAIMLGIGRVIGETMAVMMITGNSAVIPRSLLTPVRTMTATIAAEMGETVKGSPHYQALFAIGIVLFAITFVVNLVADVFMHKIRR